MKRRILSLLLAALLIISLIPSAQASATLDQYINVNFGRSYDVYSGPGVHYYRANSGKAMYGGGSARVYGLVDDWILIGYQLSSGDYRIGYITRSALNTAKPYTGVINQNLRFDSYTAQADDYCRITDDPVINNKMICTLPENTWVTVLAAMGTDWSYIEAKTSYGLMRGFVWTQHLKNSNAPQPVAPPPTAVPTPAPQPTAVPWTAPTMVPWPTLAPWTAPTAVPWLLPTPAPTAVPSSGSYYHDYSKGEFLPTAQQVYLSGSWPVYSGPGEYYFRANKGKATKGEGTCTVYGIENQGYGDWALIGYALTSGQYRIGYIQAAALTNTGVSVPYLDLLYRTKKLSADTRLTDDPIRYRTPVTILPADTYVLFLDYLQVDGAVWAYVEALAENQIMRGFIPADALI